jgi:hypothetical protein
MGNRVSVSNQMRQVYEELKSTLSAQERIDLLAKIGKQQAEERQNRKLTHKINREKRKEKAPKPNAGISGINPGLAKYIADKKGESV